MFSERKRRAKLAKVAAGDGGTLAPYRLHQAFRRTVFHLDLPEEAAQSHRYSVDVRFFANGTGTRSLALSALYRDGQQIHRSDLPAAFPVPGGVIEVATSLYGLTRMHFVRDDGTERVLTSHPRTPEGLRARFGRNYPRASRIIGAVAVVVLIVGLVLSIPQALEILTSIDVVADKVGTFNSPINLPNWANTAVLLAGFTGAIERALTVRNHWLVDADTTWSAFV